MPLHRSHGRLSPQTPRPDELPAGISPPAHLFKPGPAQSLNASKAAAAGHVKRRLQKLLGLKTLDPSMPFAPYMALAHEFNASNLASLARDVGGGVCADSVCSIVASAALDMACSRYLYDTANGDSKIMKDASKLASESRASLLCAHELAAKGAVLRKKYGPDPRFLKQQEFQRKLAANALERDALAKAAPK